MARTSVISISEDLPAAFGNVLGTLGLTTSTINYETFDPFAENPHAVFMSVRPKSIEKLRGHLARLLDPVLNAGAILILAAETNKDFEAASLILQERARVAKPKPATVMLHDVYPDAHLIHWDPQEFARLVRSHDSGLPFDKSLEVKVEGTLDEETDVKLISRAFSGFRRITVKTSPGGKSGSSVWQVEASQETDCCEPFIAKVGPRVALDEESNTWMRLILDFVPFPFRAPLVENRIVHGARRAVLVSRFVDRATRFDDYITQINDAGGAVAALFGGALRTWRCNAKPARNVKLGEVYVQQMEEDVKQREQDEITGRVPRSILPSVDRLKTAFELAAKDDPHLPDPRQLMNQLRRVSKIEVRECVVHGDLNARNLFVTWSGSQIVLIDFSHAGSPGYLSRDPSRLEVSIACDVARSAPEHQRIEYLSREDLNALYRYPLLPCQSAPRRQDGRIEAIHQIRSHVMGEGVGNGEYTITTACHLLRFARDSRDGAKPENAERRALSYRLASGLIMSLPLA